MAFSVAKSRPFRSLGLYKSSGKHAAPKGSVPAPRKTGADTLAEVATDDGVARHPAHHAATSPRLTGPSGVTAAEAAQPPVAAEKTAA